MHSRWSPHTQEGPLTRGINALAVYVPFAYLIVKYYSISEHRVITSEAEIEITITIIIKNAEHSQISELLFRR